MELLNVGHSAHVIDSLANSTVESLTRIRMLTGCEFGFTKADVRNTSAVRKVVHSFEPDVVIHFAGLKAVGESALDPLGYYSCNVSGTIELLLALRETRCRRFVFSSSATVYGDPTYLPLDEGHRLAPTSPYGRTKLHLEDILRDVAASDPSWSIALLRYFNPVGAHPSGKIGEDPIGTPNNLLPFIAQVAVGHRPALRVFGTDYDTPDGTGVRDYIHVQDIARAHLAAIEWTERARGCEAFNLGTGRGFSVLEVLRSMKEASGRDIPFEIAPRRAGDVAVYFANPDRAHSVLGWRAEHSLEDMCRSVWRWQSENPVGYRLDPRCKSLVALAGRSTPRKSARRSVGG